MFQDVETTAKPNTQTEDPTSTMTTSSNSSGVYLTGQKETSSTTTSSSISSGVYLPGQKELSSTTTSSSSSFSSNVVEPKESPRFSLSPVRPSNQKISSRTGRFSDAGQNGKKLPPLPKPKISITHYDKDNKVYKDYKIHRSAPTREFRSLNQREHLKRYVVDD